MKTLATASAFGAVMLFGASLAVAQSTMPSDGSVLPFPTPPSKSIAGPTLQDSKLVPFPNVSHIPRTRPIS